MSKINVLIADGRKLLREGVSVLLRHSDIRVVGESSSVEAAIKLIEPLGVRVVLLNIGPAIHSAVSSVKLILGAHPEVRIILLALSVSADGMRELLHAGAAGCVTKECASKELLLAIRTTAAGKLYLSPQLNDALVEGLAKPATAHRRAASTRPLAPRQRDVLRRIACGETTKEIAHTLGVSSKTVETHRRRLMLKLNRHSVAELTQYAVMEGLILLPIPV